MQTQKMSLANIQGKLSRTEMKNIMAGRSRCDDCTQLCHRDDNGDYGFGMCSPSTGGTSCHNYCCSSSNTYWC